MQDNYLSVHIRY